MRSFVWEEPLGCIGTPNRKSQSLGAGGGFDPCGAGREGSAIVAITSRRRAPCTTAKEHSGETTLITHSRWIEKFARVCKSSLDQSCVSRSTMKGRTPPRLSYRLYRIDATTPRIPLQQKIPNDIQNYGITDRNDVKYLVTP